MVVVMATLGALAPSQPPDLQGVQIDARRRNNRRIGPRIGRGRFDGERIPVAPVVLPSFTSDIPLRLLCERDAYPFYFYHGIASTYRASVRRVPRAL